MTEEPTDDPPELFDSDATDSETDRADADAPLDDLASEIRARREIRESESESESELQTGEGTLPDDDLFESVDVAEVDDEAVWESLAEEETGPEEQVGLGAEAEQAAEPNEHVVPKREFCQRCPHFTAPPETACTHEGTTIVEVVDPDSFRVRNCPVVEDEDATSHFG